MDTIRIRKSALLGSSALAVALLTSSGAWAQSCTTSSAIIPPSIAALAAGTAGSVASSIANVNTAFLTQQGSAFVANPGGAPPNTQGGGVWARGVGGEVEIKSTSATIGSASAAGFGPIEAATADCSSKVRETFAGAQVGADIARLNWGGWNVNFGTTAGYLAARSKEQLGATDTRLNFEVPFFGTYLVATYGGFFADAMVRGDYYNMELNNPGFNFFNQPFSAHGIAVSASAGYNHRFENNWFVEPSAGFIWSRTKIDAFSVVGLPGGLDFSGTEKIRDIDSQIGRASLRVGTSFNTGNLFLQPFVSASVFHEFADNVISDFQTAPNTVFFFPNGFPLPPSFAANLNATTSTSRVGTYGQFSAGVAGQVLNTGWVGFVRGDYRTGDNIEGWTANAGLRYNFLPEALPPPMIVKGPAPAIPVAAPVYWGGFYVGGFFSGEAGTSSITFFGDPSTTRPKIAGPAAGGQVGYNWQFGRTVVGLEADAGWANVHGARTCGAALGINANGLGGGFSPFFLTCENDLEWTATVTGKLGFAWERALIYVKAGGAFTRENLTIGCIFGPTNGNGINARACFNQAGVQPGPGVAGPPNPNPGFPGFTNGSVGSDDRFGGVIGFGSEFMLTNNWSAKTELNYMAFGHDNIRTSDGSVLRVNTSVTEAKVGVNYHFNPWLPR